VPEPEHLNATTPSTIAQLLNIDTQLSVQEAQLRAQLESIQQKRQSLQVVISLFNDIDKAHVVAPIEETASTPQAQRIEEKEAVAQISTDDELSTDLPSTASKPKRQPSLPKKARRENLRHRNRRQLNKHPFGSSICVLSFAIVLYHKRSQR
jgi:hypothetical protein